MLDKLADVEKRYDGIISALNEGSVTDNRKIQEMMKEKSDIEDVVFAYRKIKDIAAQIDDAKEMLEAEDDEEMKALAKAELASLQEQYSTLEQELRFLLIPKDKNEGKNIIVEIRAGTGGDESALFAGDLFRMYSYFAEAKHLRIEVMDSNPTGLGGYKEITFAVAGKDAYKQLKYESGTHRVQRVPQTESQGRIHTSAATVAVLPEAEETEVVLKDEDLRIDVCRASGPGGQSVNTTDSAVRITHIPTGIVVQCQDEKSQHKNKAKALKVLRARVYEKEEQERKAKESAERRSQIGSGDRSERIRTYNYPQNRVTDHRINLTLYKLEAIMNGELDELIEGLTQAEKEKLLQDVAV